MNIDQKLVDAFYQAAVFQKYMCEHHGWTWTSNFLREFARASSHVRFGNQLSPVIMDEVVRQHPDLGAWIKLRAHKPSGYDYLWVLGKRLVPSKLI